MRKQLQIQAIEASTQKEVQQEELSFGMQDVNAMHELTMERIDHIKAQTRSEYTNKKKVNRDSPAPRIRVLH